MSFINLADSCVLRSQNACVAFSLYILSVHAFSGNRSHDLGVTSAKVNDNGFT